MSDRPDPASESARAKRPRLRHRLRTPQEARQWRRRMAGYALAAVSFVLVVNALVGENGYLDTAQARRDIAELTAEIERVHDENQRLKDQIQRLQVDPTALEEAARRDLRLGKPGETMIVIKDGTKPRPTTPK